ncbi:unnamed protein product [Bathycoccus prasinos]
MGQGASSLQQQRNRKKNRCVTDDNEFIDVFNASFSSFQNTTAEKEEDDENKEEEEENTSDNNENWNFARRTRKRLNELRELAPSTAKPMLVLNALSDEEDEDTTTSKSKKKNGSNDRRSWQKVFDVLDAYERHQEDGDGEKYSSKSELIEKLREVAKAIRLAAKNTTEEEDDDDFYEAQHTSEGKPTPPSRLLSSPISKTPPPVKPRKLRAKNRKKNDDDDAKDDGENDDDENDSDDDENAKGGVYSEYVRNTDDLLVVAEKLSSLL